MDVHSALVLVSGIVSMDARPGEPGHAGVGEADVPPSRWGARAGFLCVRCGLSSSLRPNRRTHRDGVDPATSKIGSKPSVLSSIAKSVPDRRLFIRLENTSS